MIKHRADLTQIARRVMLERGLLPDFSAPALAELATIQTAPRSCYGTPRDLTELLWVSIDNDDSRDLDQLTVAEEHPDRSVTVYVAIADVDALVLQGSALDAHAQHNTTSVYTAGGLFPMLPEKLSTDLTSLGEGEDRVAIVVELVVGEEGTVRTSTLFQALVHNHAKLAYNAVAAWLTGEREAPARVVAVAGLETQLRLQDRVAQRLKIRRHQQGALSLRTIEPRAVFTGETLVHLKVEPKNRAMELIEDFMIAANQATVSYLKQRGIPSFRRVLRSPERWQRIVEVASRLGASLPPEPDARALEAFLRVQQTADPLRFPDLSLTIVKLMGRGAYVVEEFTEGGAEHFGLAVRGYTHATAPNRRFPDLLTHRLVKATLAGAPLSYALKELKYLADHCTEKEADAEKVERQLRKSAGALLLESRIGQRFDGIITGASEKGTWVRLLDPPVEGRVVTPPSGLEVGHRVHVKLLSTNVERGYIDFLRV